MIKIDYSLPAMEAWKKLPEGLHAEVFDNKLWVEESPTPYHQRLSACISVALTIHVNAFNLGEIWIAPVDVFLEGYDKGVVVPDLIFVSKDNPLNVERRGLFGVPDLVMEFLSPGTRKRDLIFKKHLYQRTGVKEYWLVDPDTKESTGFLLKEGAYGNPLLMNSKINIRILDKEISF